MSKNNGCLLALLELLFEGSQKESSQLPYRCRNYLLSKAERSFYGVLDTVVGSDCLIFAKVRMSDILTVPGGADKWQTHMNRIQSKHVDFLLCDAEKVQPLCAIELDDSSHRKHRRKERDKFVDEAFAAAGLKLIRVRAQKSYNVDEIRAQLGEIRKSYKK